MDFSIACGIEPPSSLHEYNMIRAWNALELIYVHENSGPCLIGCNIAICVVCGDWIYHNITIY